MIGLQREDDEGIEGSEETPREPFEPTMMRCHDVTDEINQLSRRVIGLAIEVHRVLGPGFLEKFYEEALCHELGVAGIPIERQVDVAVSYKTLKMRGQRIDLVVQRCLVVEVKAVSKVLDVHKAQTLSYLRTLSLPLGLLLNFNARLLTDDLHRVLNHRSALVVPRSLAPSLAPLPSPSSR